jgi:hypothetical protein
LTCKDHKYFYPYPSWKYAGVRWTKASRAEINSIISWVSRQKVSQELPRYQQKLQVKYYCWEFARFIFFQILLYSIIYSSNFIISLFNFLACFLIH